MGYFFLICIGIVYFLAYIFYEDSFHGNCHSPAPKASERASRSKPAQPIDTISMAQSGYIWSDDRVNDLMDTLKTMSCQPGLTPMGTHTQIYFQYQGENLVALVRDNRLLVEIHDPYWYEVDPRDVDKFAEMMRVINEMNIALYGVTLSYTLDNEKNTAQVITAAQIPVFKDPAQTRSYLEPVLRQFFQVHKMFLREIAKCGMLD